MTTNVGIKGQVDFSVFESLDVRAGRIEKVEAFPKARKPAFKLWIDFGALGIKQSSAQITSYEMEDLQGKNVAAVLNFAPRQIAEFKSEVLVLGVTDRAGNVKLLEVVGDIEPGARVF